LLFKALSNRKILANKAVRQLAKRARKYRLKYSLLNDAVWFVYVYAMFMCMLQFTQAKTSSVWHIANIAAAGVIFAFLFGYTLAIMYLGNKFKNPSTKIPRKWNFFKLEPSHFPM